MKLPFVQIGVALDYGCLLCAQGPFRHPYMLSNGSAEFPGKFPKVCLSLGSKWATAKGTNRGRNFFNPGVS